MVEEMNQTEVAYNKMPGEVEVVDDIALIQSFYGVEPERIRATTIALNFMLQMTRRPSTWVFVECQKKKSDCVFQWVQNYDIKYKFVKMTSDNDGIFLKTPLWNIGTTLCSESRLCFLDSDVVMCDSDWIEKASEAFNDYDVLSLSSHQYYEEGECKLKESIGYKWATTGSVKGGHCGFTLGMTRDVFNKLNGFDATLILDDIQTYYRICGDDVFKPFKDWVKSFTLKKDKLGIPCRLGYVETVSCHVWHGDFPGKYETMVKLMDKSGITSSDDIFDYDKRKGFATLPQWKKNSKKCVAIRNTIKEFKSWMLVIENQNKEYDIVSEFIKQMGRIDDKHKLFVCTVV